MANCALDQLINDVLNSSIDMNLKCYECLLFRNLMPIEQLVGHISSLFVLRVKFRVKIIRRKKGLMMPNINISLRMTNIHNVFPSHVMCAESVPNIANQLNLEVCSSVFIPNHFKLLINKMLLLSNLKCIFCIRQIE